MARKRIIVEEVEKVWLSTAEAAKYIGMSKSYINKIRDAGLLPFYKIGERTYFFRKDDVDRMMMKNRVI